MNANTTSRKTINRAVAAVIGIGILLGGAILFGAGNHSTEDAHEHGQDGTHIKEQAKERTGPHGGRLFGEGDYRLEVTIFEQGVAPQFRLYAYRNDKPLGPAQSQVTLTLQRLGRAPQTIHFSPEGDYLKGDAPIVEPHSFKVSIAAIHAGKNHAFKYEQVEARVMMTAAQLQHAGIAVATTGPARIATQLTLLGEVRYNDDRTVRIVPRSSGRVESVAVAAGERVKRGQLLAVLSSQLLADQRSDHHAAQQRLTLARATYAREKTLWEERISAAQDYQHALAALQEAEITAQSTRQKLVAMGAGPAVVASSNLTRLEIRSPIDGIVTDKRLAVGEAVREDSALFTLSDLSTVWVEVPVAARDLASVDTDRKVTVRANAFNAEAEGRIAYVSALVGEQTRTSTARIVLPNPKGLWRPGLPVTVLVTTGDAEVQVAVAASALQELRGWQVVFGRYGDAFEARPLTLGRSDGHMVEVIDGLLAGEQYASENSFLIKADIGKAAASHGH